MKNFEELIPEIYGVLMVLGIVMNEEEALEAIKNAKFDDETAHFILNTAKEVQFLTQDHREKLDEATGEYQLSDEQHEVLAKAYLRSQEVAEEIVEIVYLYHSFLYSVDLAEQIILNGEKEGMAPKEIVKSIRELGGLDREGAETIYITAMTRMGKEYTLESSTTRKARRLTWIGVFVLLISFIEFMFDEDTTFLFIGLGISVFLMIMGFIGVTRST